MSKNNIEVTMQIIEDGYIVADSEHELATHIKAIEKRLQHNERIVATKMMVAKITIIKTT